VDYWTKRAAIGEEMLRKLNNTLSKGTYANVVYLQLLKITLPQDYEDSIVQTQVEVQKRQMKKYEQNATKIQSEIKVLQSANQAKIIKIQAQANATQLQIQQNATATALDNTIGAEVQAYATAKTVSFPPLTAQDMSNLKGEELNKYVYYLGLMNQQKTAKLLIGLNSGLVNMG
jgi:regulator of protease activity HflC (stomatin/prohibitin superfamily)